MRVWDRFPPGSDLAPMHTLEEPSGEIERLRHWLVGTVHPDGHWEPVERGRAA